jgi:hypothetical protein
MPLYEYRKNAENTIPLPTEIRDTITVGTAASCEALLDQLRLRGTVRPLRGRPALGSRDADDLSLR